MTALFLNDYINIMAASWPQVGQYLDFRDRDNIWNVGLVIARNDSEIKVRSEGWAQKYDELIPISDDPTAIRNSRIQPFRSSIRGYTGTLKQPATREHWKFSNDDHDTRLKRVDDFLAQLQHKTCEELVQFLRGQHYFYIDFLMTNSYQQTADLHRVYQYFRKHIALANSYINFMIQKRGMTWVEVNGGSGLDDLLKWEKTFAQCYYEIVDALYTIAGLVDRLAGFMKNNEKFIRTIVGVCETHENYIAEEYNTLKLVDSAKRLIGQVYQAACSDKPPKLVFPFVYSLFQLFLCIEKSITLQEDSSAIPQLLDQLFKIISSKFDELSPEDLKHNQIDRQIEFILVHIRNIYTKHNKRAKVVEWLQNIKIRISLILIRCDKLERKLRGINRLKDHCELSMREQQNWSLTRERWKQLLSRGQCLELLFLHNDHIEIFRKSIELTTSLYRFGILGVSQVKYIWTNSVSKHPIIVKILQQFWIDISFSTPLTDIIPFIDVTAQDLQQLNRSNEQLEFEFQLTHALVKQVAALKIKNTNNLKEFENRVYDLMSHAYQRLTECLTRQNIETLIEIFSKAVLKYPDPHRLILQLYNNLVSREYFHITLYILNEIYFHSDHKSLFVPVDFLNIFLTCLQQDVTLQQVTLIIKLINEILLTSTPTLNQTHHCLKHEDFRALWLYFMGKHDDYKLIFYEWIVARKKQEYVDSYNVINPVFPTELRHYIFDHVLSDPQLLNCQRITPKQLDLVIELLLFKNLTEGRIQKRNYFTTHRNFYRLKAAEVAGETLLWQIFSKSPNHDLVATVNKHLLFFYFYYTSHVLPKVKRARVGGLMLKMINNIAQPPQGNFTLVKHTLALLTKILDLIKEKKYDSKEHESANKIKITIARHASVLQLEINYEDTIGYVANKVRDHFKLTANHFKLVSCKNDELSFESRDIPMCCFTERVFKVEDCTEEENIPAYILSFFTQQFEEQLLQMLEGKELTPDSAEILEKLELKLDKKFILSKINDIIETHLTQHSTLGKELVYYYLLEVKIINRMVEEQEDIAPYLNGRQFRNILTVMDYHIETAKHITLCQLLVSFLVNLAHNNVALPASLDLPAKCVNLMAEIATFILSNHKNAYLREYLADTFHLCYQIIELTVKEDQLLSFIVSHPRFPPLLETVLLNNELMQIRHILAEKLKSYLEGTGADNETAIQTQKTLARLLIEQIYYKIQQSIGSKEGNHRGVIEYYNILSKLITKLNPTVFQQHILAHTQHQLSFFQTVLKFLHALTRYKKVTNYLANILCGHYHVLIAIYESRPALVNQQIVSFLLEDSLALANTANNKALCYQPQTITAAFDLLQEILVRNNSQDILTFIIQTLLPTHNIPLWRTPADWAITRKIEPKQKYRGLINPGCICYMNSLLQQLYMIDDFRLHIMAVTHCKTNEDKQLEYYDKNHLEESYECEADLAILMALKELFFNLYYAEQNTISPLTFTRTFRTSDRKPLIKINEQMDIDQFESILFDRLERGMSALSQRNFIKDLFGGVYVHQILSKECAHTSQRQQEFISMSLQVKKSIQQSFQALVKIEVLDGENKYYCEKCDRKVRAEKMQTIKKLPPYLILCLKRFEFNYEIDAKIKINDYCEFTQELKLKPYSQQHNSKTTPLDQNESKNTEAELPDQYFNYKLRGVVVHTGSADSGHYYSFIEDKQGEWFEFNDEDVIPFDLAKLGEQAFGSRDNYEQCKIRNAYLLIYEKKAHPHPNPREKQTEIMAHEENRILINCISERNVEMHKFELLFLPEYEQFVQRMGLNVEQLRPGDDLQREWYSFFLSFYLLVKFRKEYLHELIEFSKKTEKMMMQSPLFCRMFLQLFASALFVEEFFVYNPNRDKCKILASLLHTALLKYDDPLKNQHNYENDELLNGVLHCLKIVFINYAPIYELVTTLRKFVEYLVKSGNTSLVVFIINKYTFEIVLFDHLFSIAPCKRVKDQYEQLLILNQETVESHYLSAVKLEGKKYYPNSASECWKLLAILFRLTNIILDREHLLKDEKVYKETPTNPSALHKYKDIFDNFRTEVIATPLNKEQLILYDSNTYRGAHAMYLVFRELRLPNRLIEIAEKGLGIYESSKYRPFMFVLSFFLNDSRTTPQEIQKIVVSLERAFKANDRYFLEIDLINQWLSKFAEQSQPFAQALQERRQFVDSILQWITKQGTPTPDLIKKHKAISNERLLHRYHGIMVSSEPKDYYMNSQRIKNQLESIMNLKYKSQRRKLNVQESFSLGTLVEYFDLIAVKWRKGKIVENNFGWLTILREGKTETKLYLWEDAERIRMAETKEEEPSESDISDISYSDSQKSMRSQSDIADR